MFIYLRRFLALLIDYGLFYFFAVFFSLMTPFEFDESFYLLFALCVPLIWAPIEAICLTKWGKTPGKKLFEIEVKSENGGRLSWGQSLRRSFIPWNRPGVVVSKGIGLWRYLIALIIASSAGSTLFFGKDISEVAVQYEQKVAGSGWVQYLSDDGRFSVQFPKKPEVVQQTFEVPNDKPINLSEVKVKKEATFSVSYLELPKKWKLFGSNTLLKGAMKVVLQHMPGANIVEQKIVKHKNYPAMDFKMKEGVTEIEGRLILVGNTLYKLSVVYFPDTPRDQQHESFLNSFELKD